MVLTHTALSPFVRLIHTQGREANVRLHLRFPHDAGCVPGPRADAPDARPHPYLEKYKPCRFTAVLGFLMSFF